MFCKKCVRRKWPERRTSVIAIRQDKFANSGPWYPLLCSGAVVQIPNVQSNTQRQMNNDRGAGTHRTSNLQVSTDVVGPGPHVRKPESFAARGLGICHARS